MAVHPIRLESSDDLRRSRLTVFFRLLLALPLIVWLVLWTVAAIVVGFVGWLVTLVLARLPETLHGFLARYVRFALHVAAYVSLAANPYPPFDGSVGRYPVDLEIDPPERQNRWIVGFRLLLAIPALLLAGAFVGARGGSFGAGRSGNYSFAVGGLAATIAFLAWFACLIRGRMPRGFRDALLYALRYVAQTHSYLLLLAQRYPDADFGTAPQGEAPPYPVSIEVQDDLQRSRLTTFFRILLALPHVVWLVLWSIAVVFTAIASWFVTLVRGTPPGALHRFHSAYVRYAAHLSAFVYLVANPFPGFTGARGYPLDVDLPGVEPQSRWLTGFRALLAVPAWIVAAALGNLLLVVGVLGWFASLITARMPQGLRNAGAYAIRYSAQVTAYALFVTDRYPFSGPWQSSPEPEATELEPSLAA